MKRALALILLITLIAAGACLFTASAGGPKFSVSLSSEPAHAGSECRVTLSFTVNAGMTGGALNLAYDSSVVRFSRYEVSPGFSGRELRVADNGEGQVRFVFLNPDGLVTDTGDIISFYFTSVSAAASSSAVTVNRETSLVYNDDYTASAFTVSGCEIVFGAPPVTASAESGYRIDHAAGFITGVPPLTSPEAFASNLDGDFELSYSGVYVGTFSTVNVAGLVYTVAVGNDNTGDGVVDSTDYIALRLWLLGTYEPAPAFFISADTDGNGSVGVLDYIMLRMYLLGYLE